MATDMTMQDRIRAAGGIVHKDGNIFFTNTEKFLAAAQKVPVEPTSKDSETWCQYIAGMIETYLESAPIKEDREAGMAAIIGRRLKWLPAAPPAIQKVPLTGEQIREAARSLSDSHCGSVRSVWASSVMFARAIEAAHNITPASGTQEAA